MFFKKKCQLETRLECLTDLDFINRFCMELNKFGELRGLTVNGSVEEELCNSFIIPLNGKIPAKYSQSYNQYLLFNLENHWELILCDDTMECLYDTLRELGKEKNDLMLYLTNDCSGYDESYKKECFGIEVKY